MTWYPGASTDPIPASQPDILQYIYAGHFGQDGIETAVAEPGFDCPEYHECPFPMMTHW